MNICLIKDNFNQNIKIYQEILHCLRYINETAIILSNILDMFEFEKYCQYNKYKYTLVFYDKIKLNT